MPEIFFPKHSCSVTDIIGTDPATLEAFHRINSAHGCSMLQPNRSYCLTPQHPQGQAVATRLNGLVPDHRQRLSDCIEQFGEDTMALATFYDKFLARLDLGSGLIGASASAYHARATDFHSVLRQYQEALLELHAVERQGRGGAQRSVLQRTVVDRFDTLNRIYRVEMDRIVPKADLGKNRGSALTSADRGLTLARRRHGRGLRVADLTEAIRLEKFAKGIRHVGHGMVAIDAGSRIHGVTQTYRNGGDWMREASVEMTGFGAGGAAGMVAGKATVSGAALGAAALGLAVTPVGWCVIIGVGIAAGFGAGYFADSKGKSLANALWNN